MGKRKDTQYLSGGTNSAVNHSAVIKNPGTSQRDIFFALSDTLGSFGMPIDAGS
jgi:hypothetical protein